MTGSPPPRVRLPVSGLTEGELLLGDAQAHYLLRVLRLRKGDELVAFDPARGLEALGEVTRASTEGATVRLGPPCAARVVAAREVVWIQGLPKADKMDGVVRDATELGATRIVPAVTRFAVVKLAEDRQQARLGRWQRVADQAARQCGRGDAPVVAAIVSWSEALRLLPPACAAFCLHGAATEPVGPRLALAAAGDGPVAFAVGPEGGLTAEEIAEAEGLGFVAASLGPFVLRTETVAAAALGALRVLEGSSGRP